MKNRALWVGLTWAAGTFALALAVGLPISLDAQQFPQLSIQPVTRPSITNDSVVMSLTLDSLPVGGRLSVGDTPQASLEVENPTLYDKSVSFVVADQITRPIPMYSRNMPAPQTLSRIPYRISLAPGESRTIVFPSINALPTPGIFSIVLQSGDQKIAPVSIPVEPVAIRSTPSPFAMPSIK